MRKKISIVAGVIPVKTDSVRSYMNSIGKKELLSINEEVELARQVAEGSETARNKLIVHNLKFVAQVAKNYQGMGLPIEDLIAFGNIGICKAAEKYDHTRGVKFITFAVWYIRVEIQTALNDLSRVVRIPSHKTKTEEYSEQSTSAPISDDGSTETYEDRYLEAEPVRPASHFQDLKEYVDTILDQLKPQEAYAIRAYYGIGFDYELDMKAIAEKLGLTNERVRQMIRRSETQIAEMDNIEVLKEYM